MDTITPFLEQAERFPLFQTRYDEVVRRHQQRKELNSEIMGYAPPVGAKPRTNARLRAASKIKADPITGLAKEYTQRPISTGGNSVGSDGSLAVTDGLKLLNRDQSIAFEWVYDITGPTRYSLVGQTKGSAFPEFDASERKQLKALKRGAFSVDNSDGIVRMIRTSNGRRTAGRGSSKPPHTQTADFSKLYTMLSKADIRIAVRFWVELIFSKKPAGNWGLKFKFDHATLRYNATWQLLTNAPPPLHPQAKDNTRNNPDLLILTADEFLGLFEFYLHHTYMVFNGKVHHQVNGLPMGAEFSVYLAQWVLSYYEYVFINEAVFNKAWGVLQQYYYVLRYIDDIFTIDCPLLHKLAYQNQWIQLLNGNKLAGIYPISLTLNLEGCIIDPTTLEPTQSIPMLDLLISYKPNIGTLHHTLYDKRTSRKLHLTPLTKYTLATSFTSEHMSTNVITSQCHRMHLVCLLWWQFADEIGGVFYELYTAGHSFSKLHASLCRYLRAQSPLYKDRDGRLTHVVYHRIKQRFMDAQIYGLPMLEHRNHQCGFSTRTIKVKPVVWPAHPPVYPSPTP